MQRVTLDIQGMHCASCVARIEKALIATPGVTSASVNLATERADVRTDAGSPVAPLLEAVRQAGYHAHQHSETPVAAQGHEHAHGHEHGSRPDDERAWRRRSLIGIVLAVPLVFLGMGWMTAWSAWSQAALAAAILVLCGGPFWRGALRGMTRFQADMDMLVALGSGAAFALSAWLLATGSHMVYFDSAGVIIALVAVGKWLEARARGQVSRAITSLMDLTPPSALRRTGDAWTQVPAGDVAVGDVLLARPGERLAADGRVVESSGAQVDESMMTGEPLPIAKRVGDPVTGGTILQSGSLTFTATSVGQGTVLSQVARLVEEAQSRKARLQRLADAVAGVFVPIVMVIAVATFVSWGLLGGPEGWSKGLLACVSVLVVACPCAMGLAVPTAIMVGSAVGARRGILIRDPAVLELTGRIDTVVLDKTGTLTLGRPGVRQVVTLDRGLDERELIRLAAAVEIHSEHPLARAIVTRARADGIADRLMKSDGFGALREGGVQAVVDGVTVCIGAPHIAPDAAAHAGLVHALERDGSTVVAVMEGLSGATVVPGKTRGFLVLADLVRDGAHAAVTDLHALGLRIILLSGDSRAAAETIGRQLGIDEVSARVRPADKEARVRALQAAGHRVAMVGDGINDAPALAAADVGIAMGAGTDIAKEAGHIVLVGSDVRLIPQAVRLSRAMMRRVRLGLAWAFLYNVVLIPIGALGLLHPMLAALAMSLSSVSVVLNALWLKGVKLERR